MSNQAKRGGGRITRGRPKDPKSKPNENLNLSSLSTGIDEILTSPNKFQILSCDEVPCELCEINKSENPDMLLLYCARCKKSYCTLCTQISEVEYNVLSCDKCLWCCAVCRPKVEKAFETDIKVEKCREYAAQLEERIRQLESERRKFSDTETYIKETIENEMKKIPKNDNLDVKALVTAELKKQLEDMNKTPEADVKRIISDEMTKVSDEMTRQLQEAQQSLQESQQPVAQPDLPSMRNIIQEQLEEQREQERLTTRATPNSSAGVNEVITEMQERENRKNNVILYKVDELHTADEEGRIKYDVDQVLKLMNYLKEPDEEDFIDNHFKNIKRLGNYEQGRNRPLLVEFVSGEEKKYIFSKLYKLKNASPDLKTISVCHDMTRAQREADKVLVERAKSLESQCSENYIFRVRGPPGKRFIKKIPDTRARTQNANQENAPRHQDSQAANPSPRRVHFSEEETE